MLHLPVLTDLQGQVQNFVFYSSDEMTHFPADAEVAFFSLMKLKQK